MFSSIAGATNGHRFAIRLVHTRPAALLQYAVRPTDRVVVILAQEDVLDVGVHIVRLVACVEYKFWQSMISSRSHAPTPLTPSWQEAVG